MKIDEQSSTCVGKFKVRKYDSFMNWADFLNGLKFHYNFLLYEEVDPVSTFKFYPLVDHGDGFLSFECHTAQCEFARQTFLLGRFEEAGPQLAVNLDCGSNDSLCYLDISHFYSSRVKLTTEVAEGPQS